MSGVHTRFTLPPELAATELPEQRGLARDEVRLLVAEAGSEVQHAVFRDLATFLRPGDLVVVNTSATRAAAVDGLRADGRPVTLHVSHRVPGSEAWVVELRSPDGAHRVRDARVGDQVRLPRGVTATLAAGHPDPARRLGSRLWLARIPVEGGVAGWVERVGHPIRYGHLRGRPPLAAYQTIFARDPGSAEMPSAGRPFTGRVLADLGQRGVGVAEVTLHTGVSSTEVGEPPPAEWYTVPAGTVQQVELTRARGGRVVAVGTTVVRALESVARDGTRTGWTDLVVGPENPPRLVDGLITGWHEPGASHLLLLEAVAGPELVNDAYTAALAAGYRWHEFGDSCLLLPNAERSGVSALPRPPGAGRRAPGRSAPPAAR
ncbi:MAG: Queuosine biosynthesis protein [Pseudonocardia sp.]|nr:Queuosine biosynthesis protein [Pseudonocardia sp.]